MLVSQFIDKKKKIDRKSFKDLMGYISPGLRPLELELLFKKLDKNNNDHIEKEEILGQLSYGFSDQILVDEKAKKLVYK